MPIKLRKHYPTTIWLDDEEQGTPALVNLHVARLTIDQYEAFNAGMERLNDPPSLRLLGGRKPDGEEQEREGELTGDPKKDDARPFRISDEAINDRRVTELDEVKRAAYEQADADDEAWSKAFVQEAISKYLSVPPGEIVDDDDQPVTTGLQLAQFYGARQDVLRKLVLAILWENTLTAAQKKVWRLRAASFATSSEPSRGEPGTTPAPIADAAGHVASAETAPAMGSSGATRPATPSSSGDPAPSH